MRPGAQRWLQRWAAGALLALVAALPLQAAPRITVEGLMPGAAVLTIDGQRKMLKEGQSFQGVTLINAQSQIATIEVEGQRQVIGLSSRVGGKYAEPETLVVNIRRDSALKYVTTAEINGRQVPVIVDTGANFVAMNETHAKRLGINYMESPEARVETASGVTSAWSVNLRSVNVGGIVINNVEAGVLQGSFPSTVLLGMTYLRHVKMQEHQGVMTLSRQR